MHRTRAVAFCLLPLVVAAPLPGASQATITGRVTDSTGHPLAHVRVTSMPWEDTTTDANGAFTLERPGSLIRFSAEGYRPVTTDQSALAAAIVLRPYDEPPRTIAACGPAFVNEPRQVGALRIRLSRGAHIVKRSDDDDTVNAVRYDGHWLTHGEGPFWSLGLPSPSILRELIQVTERDVVLPVDVLGAEYRGERRDGTHFRFIGWFGETISYDHASTRAARYFDRLLDTLCWQARPAPGDY